MHKTGETLPPIINPLQVAGVRAVLGRMSLGLPVAQDVSDQCMEEEEYWSISKVRIIITVMSVERFCQNEDTDSPDSHQR